MATQKQIAANKRNAEKSTGPRTRQGKARSRMNALRHGLSSSIAGASVMNDVSSLDNENSITAVQDRLGQIYSARVNILSAIDENAKNSGLKELCMGVRRLAALERYSRDSYSQLKKYTRTARV